MILNSNKNFTFFTKLLELSADEKIVSIDAHSQKSFTSKIFKISIQYRTNNIIQEKYVFLKTSDLDMHNAYHDFCINEIYFYKTITKYPIIDELPNCYYKYYNKKTGQTILILEDLSKEFFSVPIADIKLDYILLSCSTLSKFHASFWNDKKIDKKAFDYIKLINESKQMIASFLYDNSHLISPEWVEGITAAYKIYVELIIDEYYRKKEVKNITLINGDAHISNFMFSKKINRLPKLIDFQFWKVGLGCLDLAHLTRKTTAICKNKQIHESIVKKYHDSLVEYGIKDYTYEQCFYDYKRCVASLVLNPIWQYSKFNIPFNICIQPMGSLINNFKTINE